MTNYDAIAIEAQFRRREWQRAVETDARAAQVCSENKWKHWPPWSLRSVRSLIGPRLRFSSLLVPGRRSVAC